MFDDWLIGLGFGTAVLLYGVGWQRQPRGTVDSLLPKRWRGLSFAAAMLILAVALLSPIHNLATQFFSFHVLQRLLLVAIVPCFFFSGNPLPILFAGLPKHWRVRLNQLPYSAPHLWQMLIKVTHPVPIWFLFVSTFWLWHDPQIDVLLLDSPWLHRLENVTLLATAVLYWWHIMAASPRLHPAMPPLWRVGYAALGATPVKLVGLILLFTTASIYHYPASITFYDLQISDQSVGAAIVWAVGGMVFTWTAVLLMRTWLKIEDDKPALPESLWATEEIMLAPGFDKTSN